MSADLELVEVIRRAIESRVADVFTCLPGRVKSYNTASRTAEIVLVVRRPVPTGDEQDQRYEDLPVLPNVPVLFPRGGGGAIAITWPLLPGDVCGVMFTTWSFAGWRRTGQVSDPGDLRTHHLTSCFAIPGLDPNGTELEQSSINALVLEAPDIRLGKGASDAVALASKVMAGLNRIKSAIVNAVPATDNSGAALQASIVAALTDPFDDVGATKVKAE